MRYDHTLRVLAAADGKWGWVILKGRDPAPDQMTLDDVVTGSDRTFDTPGEAIADAQARTGGDISPDRRTWVAWLRGGGPIGGPEPR